jgi:hypothetical protein
MAKPSSRKATKAEWKGYHKINLTNEQTKEFESDYLPKEIALSELDLLANNGYKFSLSWDSYNSGISASLYCQDKKMDWAGYTLTAWADCAETATKLLLYKHYIVALGQWEIVPHEREGSSTKFG